MFFDGRRETRDREIHIAHAERIAEGGELRRKKCARMLRVRIAAIGQNRGYQRFAA